MGNRNKGKVIPFPKAEPALVRAVTVALAFLASLGVSWAADVDKGTVTTIAVVLGVLLPILQGLWTRYVVTPKAQVLAQVTASGRVIAGDAAVEPTGTEVDQPKVRHQGTSEHPVRYSGPAPTIAAVAVKPELVRPAA